MQRDATGHEPGRCGVALLTIALLGLMGAGTPIQAQTRNDALTSAAIDPTIYRDGEVRRFSSVHGNWRIVCDEVTRLHQRFCSMRSLIAQTDGSVVAELTISTGQDGRPAALLKITDALVRDGTLDVVVPPDAAPPSTAKTAAAIRKSTPQKGRTPPPRSVTRLTAVTCDRRLCTLIWTLRPEQIAAAAPIRAELGLDSFPSARH